MALFSAEYLHFLFREDRGAIDRPTWAAAAAGLAALWILLVLGEMSLNRAGAPARVGVVAIFVIASVLLAVCYYFVSAKRLRDLGRPPALALLLPAVGFIDAVLRAIQPAEGGTAGRWIVLAADLALAAVAIWNIVELGFMPGRAPLERTRHD